MEVKQKLKLTAATHLTVSLLRPEADIPPVCHVGAERDTALNTATVDAYGDCLANPKIHPKKCVSEK